MIGWFQKSKKNEFAFVVHDSKTCEKKTRKNRKAAKQNAGQLTLCIEGLIGSEQCYQRILV